jgi:hypothetical protein
MSIQVDPRSIDQPQIEKLFAQTCRRNAGKPCIGNTTHPINQKLHWHKNDKVPRKDRFPHKPLRKRPAYGTSGANRAVNNWTKTVVCSAPRPNSLLGGGKEALDLRSARSKNPPPLARSPASVSRARPCFCCSLARCSKERQPSFLRA